MSSYPPIVVVLHQVQNPENLGAVARVMSNFGQQELILSDPRTDDWQTAAKVAVHSGHVLGRMRETRSLREALGPVVHAIGTTFRAKVGQRDAVSPEDAAEVLRARAADGPVALVLGGEKRGLSDEELAECDSFVTIPTDSMQPSMNLASAAAVLLYVLTRGGTAGPGVAAADAHPAARLATVHALEAAMRAALERVGFFNPQSPDYLLDELLHTLRRAEPTQREVELWTAAFKQLGRK